MNSFNNLWNSVDSSFNVCGEESIKRWGCFNSCMLAVTITNYDLSLAENFIEEAQKKERLLDFTGYM